MTVSTDTAQHTPSTPTCANYRWPNRLLTFPELPSWMRDNDFVVGSYRPPQKSLRACFYSAFFTLNNDTINVWSHGLGFIFFLFLGIHFLGPATSLSRHITLVAAECKKTTTSRITNIAHIVRHKGLQDVCLSEEMQVTLREAISNLLNSHRLGLLPLIVATCMCLAFSTIFHVFWIHSPGALHLLARLDFLGITFLCTGHALSGIYHIFYCTPTLARRYYSVVLAAQFFAFPAIFSPSFAKPAFRPVRTAVFCALGSTSILPLLHASWSHGQFTYEVAIAIGSAASALTMYGLGAVLYVSRFPECCRVGKHDRFFASHQLMHVAVLFGVGLHMWGCWTLFEYRMEVGCSANSLFAT